MNLKQKKSSIFIILILFSLLLLSLTINKQKFNIIIHDVNQKIISLDLGISSSRNLLDDGTKEVNNNVPQRLIALIKNIPDIFHYKFLDKEAHKFEKIYIDIKFMDYQKLMLDRNNALRVNKLSNPTTNNATLKYKNNIYKATIRLKGDLSDHWTSRYRMSFKIRLKNEKTILGFNEFSIQKPSSRQHPYDYTFQSMLRDTGNLTSVHKFAHIFVNGEDWGIMDIEEHMSNELIEKQNRKSSVIVRFANEENWLYKQDNNILYSHYRLSDPFLYTHIYNKKSLKDLHNRKIYSYISNNQLLNNKEIYDIDSLSKAFIASLAWNNRHALAYPNSRYYFNPYSLKLEPITTDQGNWTTIYDEVKFHYEYFDILSNKYYFVVLSPRPM